MTTIDLDGPVELGHDVEVISKLVGTTVAKWTRAWDEERKLFREFYDIKKISGVELEVTPKKMVVLKFDDGTKDFILNLDQFSKYMGSIGSHGSIYEYLVMKGFSIFK